MEVKAHFNTQGESPAHGDASRIPLVTDLDGTLIATDSLHEGLLHSVRSRPLRLLHLPSWLRRGRQFLKIGLMDSREHVAVYPLNAPVLHILQEAAAEGREVWLATASPCPVAQAMADRLNFFRGVMCSTETSNLKGEEKARALSERFGHKGFDYIGDSAADLPVWASARKAYVYGPNKLFEKVLAVNPHAIRLPGAQYGAAAIRELRIWQWVKNTLVFLPLFLAHDFSPRAFALSLLAFVALSLCASAVYVLNDMADLINDRSHPVKCRRPLASGALPLRQGALLAGGCLAGTIALGGCLGLPVLGLLGTYFLATLSYSFLLKKILILDALVLAALYDLRVVLGCLSIGVPPSNWLLSFLLLLFFGLALMKRVGDLEIEGAKMAGRAYVARDLPLLMSMLTASGFSAVAILCLYVNSVSAMALYSRPDWLWLAAPAILCWYCCLVIKAGRGKVKGDPLLFALKAPFTWIAGAVVLVCFIFAM